MGLQTVSFVSSFLAIDFWCCSIAAHTCYFALDRTVYELRYTGCGSSSEAPAPGTSRCPTCKLQLPLPQDHRRLFLYYRLTNYYQSSVQYVTSIDRSQLQGAALGVSDLGDCSPIIKEGSVPFYPCGLISDSRFNDTFAADGLPTGVSFTQSGIAWPSDVDALYRATAYGANATLPPPSWAQAQGNLWPPSPDWITGDEHLMNWMRVSAFPTFLKLYGIINGLGGDNSNPSELTLLVSDCFPIGSAFGGTKSIFISSQSFFIGGKILALPIIFTASGTVLLLTALIILLLHKKRNRMATEFDAYPGAAAETEMFQMLQRMQEESM
ncbi:hypothetical protein DI09_69p90 [Mitosporidium daphniae]|uniref:Cell cycle control protein n=1 Tax=Mitosporidium daphniae TaxID=1485682 RepID=A0A098VNF8_9MICR|nr:uncharacterized protein DI09_69p90 [Mitosporidium daphniae]KGG50485.1 hypothetical protein DI09_69p90 [Mitosporidium daphniae]|eukprot:XP_013236928.1 uncharacterized protein DI09_69p90 [Mitosporidium daphniae]